MKKIIIIVVILVTTLTGCAKDYTDSLMAASDRAFEESGARLGEPTGEQGIADRYLNALKSFGGTIIEDTIKAESFIDELADEYSTVSRRDYLEFMAKPLWLRESVLGSYGYHYHLRFWDGTTMIVENIGDEATDYVVIRTSSGREAAIFKDGVVHEGGPDN